MFVCVTSRVRIRFTESVSVSGSEDSSIRYGDPLGRNASMFSMKQYVHCTVSDHWPWDLLCSSPDGRNRDPTPPG